MNDCKCDLCILRNEGEMAWWSKCRSTFKFEVVTYQKFKEGIIDERELYSRTKHTKHDIARLEEEFQGPPLPDTDWK